MVVVLHVFNRKATGIRPGRPGVERASDTRKQTRSLKAHRWPEMISIDIDKVHGKARNIRVYIASQYTIGDPQENVDRQINMASTLLDRGFYPFAPLLCHYIDQKHPKSYETWIDQDNVWLLQCNAVLRLPGPSKGADAEVELAKSNNMPVFYNLEDLICHYSLHKGV